MYTPPAYEANDRALLHACMRQWSFATLITQGADGPNATHLPFLLEEDQDGGNGILVTHLARANPQLEDLLLGDPLLVVFQGPHAFISPSWYQNQLTFPTWNYTAIHARGSPTLIEDARGVHAVLNRTVALYDTPLGGNWAFGDMPEELVLRRMGAIVAVRIPIDSLEGKLKLNQDKSPADRRGVIAALERQGDPQGLAVAALMRQQPDLQEQS